MFGLNQKKPNNDTLNYIGVALTLFSTVFYLFINNSKKNTQEISEEDKKINEMPTTSGSSNETLLEKNDIYQKLSSNKKRIVGISLSVFSGLMYGEAFTPILYVQDNYDEASKNNLDCKARTKFIKIKGSMCITYEFILYHLINFLKSTQSIA